MGKSIALGSMDSTLVQGMEEGRERKELMGRDTMHEDTTITDHIDPKSVTPEKTKT